MKKYLISFIFLISLFSINIVYAQEDIEEENHTTEHRTCIHLVNEYDNSEVKTCIGEGVSASKVFTTKINDTYTNEGVIYKLDGWYDKDNNLVSNDLKYRFKYVGNKETCENIYYYLKWKTYKAPILKFNYIDNISTGSGSWSNINGSTNTFTHEFKSPEKKEHYEFLYWMIQKDKYYDGDKYTYDFEDKEYNTLEEINAYAYYKADITLNLYDEKLLKSDTSFDKVTIDLEPKKDNYKFIGWVNDNNELVSDTEFYSDDIGTNPTPKVINLYAKWDKEEVTNVVKVIEDEVLPPQTGVEPSYMLIYAFFLYYILRKLVNKNK